MTSGPKKFLHAYHTFAYSFLKSWFMLLPRLQNSHRAKPIAAVASLWLAYDLSHLVMALDHKSSNEKEVTAVSHQLLATRYSQTCYFLD